MSLLMSHTEKVVTDEMPKNGSTIPLFGRAFLFTTHTHAHTHTNARRNTYMHTQAHKACTYINRDTKLEG